MPRSHTKLMQLTLVFTGSDRRGKMFLVSKMNHNSAEMVGESCNKFAIEAYKIVAIKNQHNFVFSPFGAHAVLSILACGADGKTKLEMMKGLQFPEKEEVFLKGFPTIFDSLKSLSKIETAVGVTHFLANTLNIESDYSKRIKKYFSSTYSTLDFTESEKSADIINAWCAKATKNYIRQIISKDDIDERTAILLVSTIYFKAEWKYKFDRVHTKWNKFYINETETTDVPYMFQYNDFFHGELQDIDAQFLELPYKNKKCVMVILLPNKIGGLSDLERNLDKINYECLMTVGNKQKICLYLPKFSFDSTIELNECLKNMGMESMFTNDVNFRRITKDKIKAVKVLQKSFIAIDEKGTIATSATASHMEYICAVIPPPTVFRADRPFMVMIMYEKLSLFFAKFTGGKCQYDWTNR